MQTVNSRNQSKVSYNSVAFGENLKFPVELQMVDRHKLELNRSMNCCRVALNETKFFSYVICQQSIMVKKWIEKKPSIQTIFKFSKNAPLDKLMVKRVRRNVLGNFY